MPEIVTKYVNSRARWILKIAQKSFKITDEVQAYHTSFSNSMVEMLILFYIEYNHFYRYFFYINFILLYQIIYVLTE